MKNQKYFANSISYELAIQQNEANKVISTRYIEKLRPYVKENFILFDIGSNVGYFTYLFFNLFGPTGKAYLFEPIGNLVDISRTLLKRHNINAIVNNYGLSDKDGEEDILIANDGNIGWNTMIKENASHDMIKQRALFKKFDTCGITETPTFIKIDVEGAEFKVINGMMESIQKWNPKPVILCEIGWGTNHHYWKEEVESFINIMRLGYRPVFMDNKTTDILKINKTTDVLFVPREQNYLNNK